MRDMFGVGTPVGQGRLRGGIVMRGVGKRPACLAGVR